MPHFTNAQVQGLYFLAADAEEPMINDMQREAVRELGRMVRKGNAEAQVALTRLARLPDLHPLLREIVRGEMGLPAPKRAVQAS
jgi:hypothetical protein